MTAQLSFPVSQLTMRISLQEHKNDQRHLRPVTWSHSWTDQQEIKMCVIHWFQTWRWGVIDFNMKDLVYNCNHWETTWQYIFLLCCLQQYARWMEMSSLTNYSLPISRYDYIKCWLCFLMGLGLFGIKTKNIARIANAMTVAVSMTSMSVKLFCLVASHYPVS